MMGPGKVVDDYTSYFVASGFFHDLVMHSNGWQCNCKILPLLSRSDKPGIWFYRGGETCDLAQPILPVHEYYSVMCHELR